MRKGNGSMDQGVKLVLVPSLLCVSRSVPVEMHLNFKALIGSLAPPL